MLCQPLLKLIFRVSFAARPTGTGSYHRHLFIYLSTEVYILQSHGKINNIMHLNYRVIVMCVGMFSYASLSGAQAIEHIGYDQCVLLRGYLCDL